MAQLGIVIDIPDRVAASLPSFVQLGEELARQVRADTGDVKAAFITAGVTDQKLIPAVVTTDTATISKTSASQKPKRSLISGGAAGNLTVSGIKTTSVLLAVCKIVDANQAFTDLTTEFTVTAANTINNTGGTSTASSHVLVVWV